MPPQHFSLPIPICLVLKGFLLMHVDTWTEVPSTTQHQPLLELRCKILPWAWEPLGRVQGQSPKHGLEGKTLSRHTSPGVHELTFLSTGMRPQDTGPRSGVLCITSGQGINLPAANVCPCPSPNFDLEFTLVIFIPRTLCCVPNTGFSLL